MGTGGWRRAFCTSVRRDTDAAAAGTRVEAGERHQRSPRSCATKLSFFSGGSNPSTPRLALAEAAPGLRCRTKSKTTDNKTLQCDAATSSVPTATTRRSRSPALFHRQAFSAPSSPRTASRFALFKHLSRSRCRICAKRLIPLRRMSRQGQRAARQIVERLVVVGGGAAARGATVGDALRKATKVLEDRRERNPVATIMLLSDSRQQQPEQEKKESNHRDYKSLRSPRGTGGGHIGLHLATTTAATRFAHLEIPIQDAGFGDGGAERSPQKQGQVPSEDAFIKCVGGLVSVVMQDVRLQLVFPSGEFSAVHQCGGGGDGCNVALRGGTSVIRLGDLYAEEERELLVELRLPVSPPGGQGGHHRLSVKCNYKDPTTQDLAFSAEQILLLPPVLQHHSEPGRSAPSSACTATSLRLRNIFVSTRAVAESRRLADFSDYATARHLLSSARALILQSASDGRPDHHLLQNLDAELAALQRRRYQAQHRLHHDQLQEEVLSPSGMRRRRREAPAEVRGEPLTPTSAWRAAEQLAKVAITRKTLNRVGDLHGFENARF
ncbi:hypothetical protein OPV22_003431 [Ensete ventricosum]|uniref:E3 ubiquitin-protein ligase WAV3-like C-terminal domain-containing protein n=1 Tax=Ensete ventricosum TaxID=4639 RepID=A0AAV8S0J6_ENSVE|nr:hypothetical protein OPV22_003431 [Ensete ventricosum]